MKHFIFIILICQFCCGCSFDFFNRKPGAAEAPAAPASSPQFKPQPPVSGSVDLYEAMARGVFHKLGYNTHRLKTELQNPMRNTRYNAMISKTLAAGYTDIHLSESALKNSSDADSLQKTGAELSQAWDVLDMGILYAAGRTASNAPDFDKLLAQKAFQNMSQAVKNAYYRSASADLLLAKSEKLLQKARAALKKSRETFAKAGSATQEAVENQKKLIENTRRLWHLNQLLGSAKAELNALMNVKPGTAFQIDQPDWQHPNTPILLGSTVQWEHSALTERPELINKKTSRPDDVNAVRQALLAHHANLEFDIDYDGKGASMVYDRNWLVTGVKLASRLFGPPAKPLPGINPVSNASMAGVTQIQVARQRFAASLENYQLAQMMDEAAVKNPSDRNRAVTIQQETDALIARIRFHMAYAELQNAADRMYASVGMTALPDHPEKMSVSQLSHALAQGFTGQSSRMAQGDTASAPPVTPISPKASPAPSRQPALQKTATPPPQKLPPKIRADSMKQSGRKVAKEISIFRDVVNIHAEPSYHAAIIGQGLIGEKYPLKGWSPDGWIQIEMSAGALGWVPTKYIKPVDPVMPSPVPKPATPSKPAPKKVAKPTVTAEKKSEIKASSKIVTVKRSNIRTEPSIDAAVIFIEEIGVQFTVGEVSGEWCRITLKNDSDGWLHMSVVESVDE